MKPSAAHLPSRQAVRLHILHAVCGHVLAQAGSINLGRLVRSLQHSSPDSQFGNVVVEYGYAFTDATSEDFMELCEDTLNLLEQDFGPLICEALEGMKGFSALPWGYAGIAMDAGSRSSATRATPRQLAEMRRRRARALAGNHPDQSYICQGQIPYTTWYLVSHAPKRIK